MYENQEEEELINKALIREMKSLSTLLNLSTDFLL